MKNNNGIGDSREFVEYVKNCRHVQKNEIFVSFDVVSLFTSVPVDKVFDLVLELLSSDDALPSRTSLSISDIKQLRSKNLLGFYYLFLQRLFLLTNLGYSHGFLHLPYHR